MWGEHKMIHMHKIQYFVFSPIMPRYLRNTNLTILYLSNFKMNNVRAFTVFLRTVQFLNILWRT